MTAFPNPDTVLPIDRLDRVALLKPLTADDPRIEVGDFTYYDDPDDATGFATRNVLYGYGPEKLIIGRYCALATGTTFLLSGADHPTGGVSTYPFTIFGGEWTERTLDLARDIPSRGDTVVGSDVWFGYRTIIMPGVHIGDGAVIAAGSLVTKDVEPYTVVGGNPAKPIRRRFTDEQIHLLRRAAWWHWPNDMVTQHVRIIMGGTPEQIYRLADDNNQLRTVPGDQARHRPRALPPA